MFIDNKYTKWYYSVIQKSKACQTSDYVEKHHIIPTCLGGNNKKENVVPLSPREHFVCHLLLTKMTTGQHRYKMCFALSMLSKVKNIGKGRYVVTGRLYDYARQVYKEALDSYWTLENRKIHAEKIRLTSIGRKHSKETIEKMRNKSWTEKAIKNRIDNCLRSAEKRKGKKNPEHGKQIFQNYVINNTNTILQIWKLYDQGLNRRRISLQLNITWDRVNLAINKRTDIMKLLEN